jgi:hypothetical protein
VLSGGVDVAAGVQPVLGDGLGGGRQRVLLGPGGSVTEAGARLFCHPNTVRYRLRKLVELTGRSTDAPDGISELIVAVHAWRLVGDPGGRR